MASIYDLKPKFQNLLRPLCGKLVKMGCTANGITLTAMFVSCGVGLSIFAFSADNPKLLLLVPIYLFIRMALNAIDGMMARENGMKTPLGAILNELGDIVSDIGIYLPLGFVAGISMPWMISILFVSTLGEVAGILGTSIGASRRYDGPMGKSDRAFVFGLLSLLLAAGVPGSSWVTIYLIIVCILSVATLCNRVHKALKEVGKKHV